VAGDEKTERPRSLTAQSRRQIMAWTRPKLREICIGMEINGYFAARM
jgi:coenzyme PQQ precursor peptide PqqA